MASAKFAKGVTQLLHKVREGDQDAEREVLALVYDELRTIAAHQMRSERRDHTLQPTALVNEAYVRMAHRDTDWKDRAHFFAVASQVMRHILVDYARQRRAEKRGAGVVPLNADFTVVVSPERFEDILLLDDLLQKLEAEDPRAAQVVVYRFFGGLGIDEIADVLKISSRSVKRDWSYGRAWLKTALGAKQDE